MNLIPSPERPRILDMRPTPNSGKRLAFADVEIDTPLGTAAFFDCALFQSEDGTFSVGAPSKPNTYGGPKKFLPLVRWDKALTEAITNPVAEAYRLHCQSEADPTFQGEVRRRANLPPERPNAAHPSTGRYGDSGGRR